MESEIPSPPDVNGFALENESEFAESHREVSGHIDRRTFSHFLRIEGYLNGAWGKSRDRLGFLIWDAPRFNRKTKTAGKVEIPLRTLERVFPSYQRWTDAYLFQRVNVRGRWRVFVYRNDGVQLAVPGATIRDRLIAAIASYVQKAGRCAITREFVAGFCERTALPRHAVAAILSRDKHLLSDLRGKIPGCACRWRGNGVLRKLVVTHPGRRAEVEAEGREKMRALYGTGPPAGREIGTDRPANLPAGQHSYRNERFKNSGLAPAEVDRARAPPEQGAGTEGSQLGPTAPDPQTAAENSRRKPDICRTGAAEKPLHICGRYVRPWKLKKCARWLAGARLKFAHVNRERVAWIFAHAYNFSLCALRHGYQAEAIERAWAAGVDRSHEDALGGDKLPRGLLGVDHERWAPPRLPSAVSVYAWLAIRSADPRSPEELWGEFFSHPPRPRDSRDEVSARTAAIRAAQVGAAQSTATPEMARVAAPRPSFLEAIEREMLAGKIATSKDAASKLREKIRAMEKDQAAANSELAIAAGDLVAYLKTQSLSLAQFNALSYAMRRKLLNRAIEFRGRAEGGEK